MAEDFPTATGLATLPSSEPELKKLFTEIIKEPAAAFGQDPNSTLPLAEDLRKYLDNQREYNLSLDRNQAVIAQNTALKFSKFGAVVLDMRNGVNFAKEQVGEGAPFVNIKDIFTPSGVVNCDALARVRLTEKELRRFRISEGDLVFVRSSVKYEGVGWPAIVKPGDRSIVFCGFVIKCSLDQTLIDPYFAMQLFRSARGRREILSRASRANITNISQDSLADIVIPLPPLDDQRAIAREVEACQRVVEGCAAVIKSYRPTFTASPDWPRFALHEIAEIDPRRPKLALPPDAPVSFLPMAGLPVHQGAVAPKQERPLSQVIKGYTYFCEHDLLIAKITPCFENGKMTVVGPLKNQVGFGSTEFFVLRANKTVLPEFLYLSLCDPSFIELGEKSMTGAAGQQRVMYDFINGYLIAVPPLDIQRALVAELQKEQSALASLADLQAKFEAKIAARLAAVWGELHVGRAKSVTKGTLKSRSIILE